MALVVSLSWCDVFLLIQAPIDRSVMFERASELVNSGSGNHDVSFSSLLHISVMSSLLSNLKVPVRDHRWEDGDHTVILTHEPGEAERGHEGRGEKLDAGLSRSQVGV